MTDLAGNVLQRLMGRLVVYSRATFGVRLTLSDDGNGTPHDRDPEGLKTLSRTIGYTHGGRRLLLVHGIVPSDGALATRPPGQEGAIHRLSPGQLRALDDFLDMAAGLLGILADAQDAVHRNFLSRLDLLTSDG